MSRNSTNTRGFTLLEMLIAIAIFSLIGLASNAVLQTVLSQDEQTKQYTDHLKGLQQGMWAMERDFSQMVARTFRGEEEHGSAVLVHGTNLLESDSETLIFHRLGWLNPDGVLPRGSLQSVAYRVFEGRLERLHFPLPEPIIGEEPTITVIAEEVLAVRYSFFYDKSWTQEVTAELLPKGIALEVEFEDNSKLLRKFLLPGGQTGGANDSDEENGGNNNGNNNNNNSGNNSGNNNSGSSSREDGEPE
ncbi:type II secretion system minor pseudopilin GspJ [Paraferrimonas sedimenticola]|uniref:Type II secretion system protein J n=1 Tax=Paraferrimonas sedimenticola TaxID=375674 RepID=A0AA37VUH2_9GAMM|nr:type II secretion system minor pseudopilin GspJ [Paraferrimonas sedimenticola]GLP95919.1 type II secretion system protein GspJ [Paraferrimonas sedimenticola]